MKLGLFHFQLLYNVLENIHFIYDEGELAEVVLEKVGEALNAGAGTVFRIEEDGTIVPLASQGVSLETLRRTEFRVGKGVAGWVAKYVQPVKVDDPKKDSRFSLAVDKETGFKTRSIVAAPILAKGRAIGVIEFLNRRDGAFTVPDLELISMIGREVGIAFENALLVRELRRSRAFLESMVDSLSAGLIVLDADGRVIEFNPRGRPAHRRAGAGPPPRDARRRAQGHGRRRALDPPRVPREGRQPPPGLVRHAHQVQGRRAPGHGRALPGHHEAAQASRLRLSRRRDYPRGWFKVVRPSGIGLAAASARAHVSRPASHL
jgi:putative methionine-R-sulfoxide reductase with GAF domain